MADRSVRRRIIHRQFFAAASYVLLSSHAALARDDSTNSVDLDKIRQAEIQSIQSSAASRNGDLSSINNICPAAADNQSQEPATGHKQGDLSSMNSIGPADNLLPQPAAAPKYYALTRIDRQIQSILPSAQEELWQQIPWQRNLMEARVEAQRLHRPMFVWVMNGNPFGCT